MKYTDFAVQAIELSHDQAITLKQKVIEAIENYGIENFEKRKEIELPDMHDDPIRVYVDCEIYSDYSGSFQRYTDPPEPEHLLSRSVMRLAIQLINEQGDEVQWTVLGEKSATINGGKYTATPIDIEEEITKHFTITPTL